MDSIKNLFQLSDCAIKKEIPQKLSPIKIYHKNDIMETEKFSIKTTIYFKANLKFKTKFEGKSMEDNLGKSVDILLQPNLQNNLKSTLQKKWVKLGLLSILVLVLLGGVFYAGMIVNSQKVNPKDIQTTIQDSSSPLVSSTMTIPSHTDQIIIKYKASADLAGERAPSHPARLKELSTAAGISLEYFRKMSGGAHVLRLPNSLPDSEVRRITDRLMALSDVEYAEPDSIIQINQP